MSGKMHFVRRLVMRMMIVVGVLLAGISMSIAQDTAPDTSTDANTENSVALIEDGRYLDALAMVNTALLAPATDPIALLQIRAEILAFLGREAEALADIESLLDQLGTEANENILRELRTEQARLTLLTGDAETTGVLLDALADDNPDDARLLGVRGLWHLANNDVDTADTTFQRGVQVAGGDPTLYMQYGFFFNQTGRATEAIPQYDQALSLEPANPEALNGRGVAYLQSAQYDLALADFTQAIALAPQWVIPRINAGIAQRIQGNIDEALALMSEAITIDPAYSEAFLARAFTYIEQGNNASDDATAFPAYDSALGDLVAFVNLVPTAEDVPLEIRALILQLENILGGG